MKRLTGKEQDYYWLKGYRDPCMAIDQLGRYEDIGFLPEELQEIVDKQKWHVVTEGDLPEDDREVLITYKSNIDGELNVDITSYCEVALGGRGMGYKEWGSPFPYFHVYNEVLAWRELPEPWEGAEE
ncbi:hypothetical protein LI142_23125 [Eubacterium limosum]|uniref:DUF551 domain-containing protein n=1 Tax=Eubacterium limosum TaxID=1736 RepID=A0ABT5UV34_EUBLI|nr:hypothetical protein [Eubacterium limosum]MCB6572386.1 hypothetical protein [Eubacterium limosum]MDE1472818.1 hypothetical protein [Eubacterium limosum]